MVNKGFVPAMILTIFPINSLVTYHFKTSYKHFIIKNSEKYDDLLWDIYSFNFYKINFYNICNNESNHKD